MMGVMLAIVGSPVLLFAIDEMGLGRALVRIDTAWQSRGSPLPRLIDDQRAGLIAWDV